MTRPVRDSAQRANAAAGPSDALALETLPCGPLGWQVLVLAAPTLGEQIGTFCVTLVDTFLAGQISKEATAAVGSGAYMGWFVSLAFTLIAAGSNAIVARAMGAGEPGVARRTMNQALLMSLALGGIVCVAAQLAAPLLATLLTQTEEARRLFLHFLRIDALGYPLFGVYLVLSGALRAAGAPRSPMVIMLGINVVNAALASTFVFGWLGAPQLGVTGIAVATVIARSLGGLAMLWLLARGVRGLRFNRADLRIDRATQRRMLRVGLPAAGDVGLSWIGQMAFLVIVAHSGAGESATVNYAAHMISIRVESLSFLPATAWMTAVATVVGQYLGAGRPDLAARGARLGALQAGSLCALVGAGFFLFAETIFAWMSGDPAVQAVGAPALRLMAFVQPFNGMTITFLGALRGAGDTRSTLLISLIGALALRIPLAWLFGVHLGGGLIGAWIGMWADNLGKFAMSLARLMHGGWMRVRVTT